MAKHSKMGDINKCSFQAFQVFLKKNLGIDVCCHNWIPFSIGRNQSKNCLVTASIMKSYVTSLTTTVVKNDSFSFTGAFQKGWVTCSRPHRHSGRAGSYSSDPDLQTQGPENILSMSCKLYLPPETTAHSEAGKYWMKKRLKQPHLLLLRIWGRP